MRGVPGTQRVRRTPRSREGPYVLLKHAVVSRAETRCETVDHGVEPFVGVMTDAGAAVAIGSEKWRLPTV